jgi:hypothetical protein
MTPAKTRSADRVQVEAFVIVRGERDEELVFRTRDLSEHGLFLYTKVARSYPFKVGSTLRAEIYDFDDSFECKVVVVRIVEAGTAEAESYPTGFGVRILDADAGTRAKLKALISRAVAGRAPY